MTQSEPLMQDNKDRFVIFPVKHHDIWDFYKKIEAMFRTTEKNDLQQVLTDGNKNLTADEEDLVKQLITFFATSNRILTDIFTEGFLTQVKNPEAKFFYGIQNVMEHQHHETYSLLINTYIKDEKEKNQLFEATTTSPAFQQKMQWVLKISQSQSLAERLVAFAAAEALFLSAASGTFLFLKQSEILPGFTSAIDKISSEKTLHLDFAVNLHNNHLLNKLAKMRIKEIFLEAFKIEKALLLELLSAEYINPFVQHLEFRIDELLQRFDCEIKFGTANPFEVNEDQEKSGILLKRAGELQKANNKISRETDL